MKFQKRGFTLIELLVVIAIIGILASIVLVSFPGASKKAKDSRIVSAVSQARTVMSYVYANDGSYDNFTCSHADMVNLCAEITANGGTNPVPVKIVPATVSTAACIYSVVNAKASTWYCASSDGRAGYTIIDPGSDSYCGATTPTGNCPAVTG